MRVSKTDVQLVLRRIESDIGDSAQVLEQVFIYERIIPRECPIVGGKVSKPGVQPVDGDRTEVAIGHGDSRGIDGLCGRDRAERYEGGTVVRRSANKEADELVDGSPVRVTTQRRRVERGQKSRQLSVVGICE